LLRWQLGSRTRSQRRKVELIIIAETQIEALTRFLAFVEDQGRGVGVAVIKKSSIANNGRQFGLDWDGPFTRPIFLRGTIKSPSIRNCLATPHS
jgi:hypothetical protein